MERRDALTYFEEQRDFLMQRIREHQKEIEQINKSIDEIHWSIIEEARSEHNAPSKHKVQ